LFKSKWDIQWHHFYGGYRHEYCKLRKRSSGGRTECCGVFPSRFPFDANTRQCCNGQIKGHGYLCPGGSSTSSSGFSPGPGGAGAFDDGIGRKKRSDENRGNYNPNPQITHLRLDDNEALDYDLTEQFLNYNY